MKLKEYIEATDKQLESFKGDKRLFWAGQMCTYMQMLEKAAFRLFCTYAEIAIYAKDQYVIACEEVEND